MRICLLLTVALTSLLAPYRADACGGFFCDSVTPVVQTAERILFRVNGDGTTSVVVEIQYEGRPVDFAWVVPIPEVIPASSVSTAPAGMFDELEAQTAPVFSTSDVASGSSRPAGGCGWARAGGAPLPIPDVSGVVVVGSAVVGPYSVQIITADAGANLTNWLVSNGYQVPQRASTPMQYYIDRNYAFLGVKLQPDVQSGPIDAISFTIAGDVPCIPLILTAIAATEDMEIVVYVVGEGRYVPQNYDEVDFDFGTVSFVDAGRTNYDSRLAAAIDSVGGMAFETEFAGPLDLVLPGLTPESAAVLGNGAYLTRSRTFISPAQMTTDPMWVLDLGAPDVSNEHQIPGVAVAAAALPPAFVLLMWLAFRRKARA